MRALPKWSRAMILLTFISFSSQGLFHPLDVIGLNVHSTVYSRQTAVPPAQGFQRISHKFRFLVSFVVLVQPLWQGIGRWKLLNFCAGIVLDILCKQRCLLSKGYDAWLLWEQVTCITVSSWFCFCLQQNGLKNPKLLNKETPTSTSEKVDLLSPFPGWDWRSPLFFLGEMA